jgi:hypothetical protein
VRYAHVVRVSKSIGAGQLRVAVGAGPLPAGGLSGGSGPALSAGAY